MFGWEIKHILNNYMNLCRPYLWYEEFDGHFWNIEVTRLPICVSTKPGMYVDNSSTWLNGMHSIRLFICIPHCMYANANGCIWFWKVFFKVVVHMSSSMENVYDNTRIMSKYVQWPHWCILIQVNHFKSIWRHDMETFSALLAFCGGIQRSPSDFSNKGSVMRSFDISLC